MFKRQEIHSGSGARGRISKIPSVRAAEKVMVVCDYVPVLREIVPELEKAGVRWMHFDGFGSNPVYEDLMRGAALFRAEACDFILSAGGGSAMDTAKGILLFSGEEGVPAAFPHLAVPTTAGTGSESTHFAVLYRGGVKESAAHPALLPDIVILDPDFLETLPDYQKKATMMDAICQAVESYWAMKHSPESRSFSQQALSLMLPALEDYLAGSKPALERMLLGSNLSGRAINLTQTTAAHAMSYKLSSLYGAAHGHAVALCLPGVMRLTAEKLPAGSFSELCGWFGVPDLAALADWFEALLRRLGLLLPASPSEEEYRELAASVNAQRLGNHPVPLSREEIEAVYRALPRG